jgi:N-acetylmuramoyl-L-alanine amidase
MQRRALLVTGLRHTGAGAVALGVTFVAPRVAQGAMQGPSIVAVRVWPADAYTRVTIESDVPLSSKVEVHRSPARLSINFDGMTLGDALRDLVSKVRADDPFIASVRVAQYQPGIVRLVLDLKQEVDARSFALEPVAAYRHRTVFDLHPTTEPDPLVALLRSKKFVTAKREAPTVAAAPAPAPAASAKAPPAARVQRLTVVALDPGHGGEDPGATGPTGLREKDVVLAVAEALAERINAEPSMRAFLTRDGDYFVPLDERVRKARRAGADLFVSIHADAVEDGDARGASVFALSERGASSTTARWLARKENASDDVGGVDLRAKKLGKQDVVKTILEMSTAAQIKDSLRVGSEVLNQLDRVGNLHKAQVEQAGFAVLKAPDIPSILVETAFISNPEEEKKLRRADYQQKLVSALHAGIKRYFAKNPPTVVRRTT